MVLLRHLLGDALRRLRLRQGRTLREVSAAARVSLGYLSEVERGQKEASSELLAAICSALGAPLSQVLREVSDNFAFAELQAEPVFAGVIEPAIEVTGAGHSSGHDGAPAEVVPVGAGSGGPGLASGPGSHLHLSAAQLSAGQLSAPRLSQAPLGRPGAVAGARKITVTTGPQFAIGTDGPSFDQVNRSAREITTMVPV
jgi:transcriptional regulator with XRE-family HTH domain